MSTGHPSNFGFVQCEVCGTQIPKATSRVTSFGPACDDAAWCALQLERTSSPFSVDALDGTPGFDANGSEAP